MIIEKVEKLVRTLQTYPEFFDQATWGYRKKLYTGRRRGPNSGADCGTRGCQAAYTVMMEGYSLLFEGETHYTEICHKGKKKFNIRKLAAEILGLDQEDANILFDASGDGWRHEKEFNEAHESREVDVAIMELEDLIKLGPYSKKPQVVEQETHSLQEANAQIISAVCAASDAQKVQESEVLVEK